MAAHPAAVLVLPAAWALAAIGFDAHAHRIPNRLVVAGLVLACASFALTRNSPTGEPWTRCCLLATGVGLLCLAGYGSGKLGAGDVKFLTVLALLGGVHATAWALLIGGLLAAGWSTATLARSRERRDAGFGGGALDLPLAVPCGLGFLCALVGVAGAVGAS